MKTTASILPLYDGARLKKPTIGGKETTWSKIDKEVGDELRKMAAEGKQIRIPMFSTCLTTKISGKVP